METPTPKGVYMCVCRVCVHVPMSVMFPVATALTLGAGGLNPLPL